MAKKDIISRDTLKRLTTDLARPLLGVDGEAVELLKTQNQRGLSVEHVERIAAAREQWAPQEAGRSGPWPASPQNARAQRHR